MNQLPTTLNELANDLARRVKNARLVGDRLVFVERWELESILTGEFLIPDDPDMTDDLRTGHLAVIPMPVSGDITQRHVPIQITTAENYIRDLECNSETREMKAGD